MRFVSVLFVVVAASSFACLGGGYDNTTSTDGSTNHAHQSSSGSECTIGDDCPNIACLCDDGSSLGMPVNGRDCINGSCEDASSTCPGACSDFGYTWTGTVVSDSGGSGGCGGGTGGCGGGTGGCGGGSGGLDGGGGAAPGSACSVSDDCQAHDCFCPDGFQSGIRDCLDSVCQGDDLCVDQCCALGHGC